MKNSIQYCPARTVNWRGLLQWSGPSCDVVRLGWPSLSGSHIIPFSHGRAALWFLCHHWKLQQGDHVLLPAYNCGSEIDPFHTFGAKVTFYRVDKSAQLDIEDIQARCGNRTRVVYLTHYFGWQQQIEGICAWCAERGIKVVEDCALSLFSRGAKDMAGARGDAVLFSFKKSLPVPDGAALLLNDASNAVLPDFKPPAPQDLLQEMMPFAKSGVLDLANAAGLYPAALWLISQFAQFKRGTEGDAENCEFELPAVDYFKTRLENRRFSRYTANTLARTDPGQVIHKRRRNYAALQQSLADLPNVRFLFDDLPEGVCPLGLPILFSRRMAMVRALNAAGIAAIPWWSGFHRDFSWQYHPEAKYLKQNIVLLPVNQELDLHHVNYIGESVCKATEQLSRP